MIIHHAPGTKTRPQKTTEDAKFPKEGIRVDLYFGVATCMRHDTQKEITDKKR